MYAGSPKATTKYQQSYRAKKKEEKEDNTRTSRKQ